MYMTGTTAKFDFAKYATPRRQLVEARLTEYLPQQEPAQLWESMRYSVLSGGKRIRALLCIAAAEVVSSSHKRSDPSHNFELVDNSLIQAVLPCCCAIEMVHAMSLIHDDLPAMDNDDLRRGKPTNHKVFGEATALLAGDALLMLANEILINRTPASVPAETVLSVVAELAKAVGPQGMVAGQIYDLAFTGSAKKQSEKKVYSSDIELVETIHKYKTAAFIRFSTWAGARLSGARPEVLKILERYAELLGLAFQITDDVLDFTGDAEALGKTPGKDLAAAKTTWVTLFGLDGARKKLKELEDEGLTLLDNSALDGASSPALKAILQYAIQRTN